MSISGWWVTKAHAKSPPTLDPKVSLTRSFPIMQDPKDIFWIRISLEVSVNPFLAGPHGASFSVRKRMSLLLGDSKELLELGTYSWARRARKNDLGRMRARWYLGEQWLSLIMHP